MKKPTKQNYSPDLSKVSNEIPTILFLARSIKPMFRHTYLNLKNAVTEFEKGKLFPSELSVFRFYQSLYNMNAACGNVCIVKDTMECRALVLEKILKQADHYRHLIEEHENKIKYELENLTEPQKNIETFRNNVGYTLTNAIVFWNFWYNGLSGDFKKQRAV
ncbi:MAG: hypothetical protein WCI97_05830 [Bacteroidota bacterium]